MSEVELEKLQKRLDKMAASSNTEKESVMRELGRNYEKSWCLNGIND